jgi:hypothetical protein
MKNMPEWNTAKTCYGRPKVIEILQNGLLLATRHGVFMSLSQSGRAQRG